MVFRAVEILLLTYQDKFTFKILFQIALMETRSPGVMRSEPPDTDAMNRLSKARVASPAWEITVSLIFICY